MAVFTGGVNMGPYEAAKHIAGVSARELSMVRDRHTQGRSAPVLTLATLFGFDLMPVSAGR